MDRYEPSNLSDFTVAVFSYNRGALLENCVTSCLENLLGAKIIVYDDDSDDEFTQGILRELTFRRVEIVKANPSNQSERHGGLYRNMQRALDECKTRFLVFLQDDTQVVRRLDLSTSEIIRGTFADPDIAFLRPQFFKQMDVSRFLPHFKKASIHGTIRPKSEYKSCDIDHAYCDVMIADAKLLQSSKWQFQMLERDNQTQARDRFRYMPYLQHPFVFYCPEVPSYRDRKLYWASRIVQNSREGQIINFHQMTEEKVSELFKIDDGCLPVAENFLAPSSADVVFPFVFQDYARTWWLHALYKVESRLWRMASPIRKVFRKRGA